MDTLHTVIKIAELAGQAIMGEYGKEEIPLDWKADDSPLTRADIKAHEVITRELNKAFPEIPLLSEEGKSISFSDRKNWKQFWCVDPMDGTKEFIKKTGQFTVNIALIENEKAILGVIYAPVLEVLYYAIDNSAFKKEKNKEAVKIQCREVNFNQPVFVASKDHAGPMVKELVDRFPTAELLSMGSSLKFCLVAEGKADCYLRDIPTYEWDTAAAQAIVEAAGGSLLTLKALPLTYNKENIRNPSIITLGKGEGAKQLFNSSIL